MTCTTCTALGTAAWNAPSGWLARATFIQILIIHCSDDPYQMATLFTLWCHMTSLVNYCHTASLVGKGLTLFARHFIHLLCLSLVPICAPGYPFLCTILFLLRLVESLAQSHLAVPHLLLIDYWHYPDDCCLYQALLTSSLSYFCPCLEAACYTYALNREW